MIKYLRALAPLDCLSLDVFDTALLRRVARPIDVFSLVEGRYRHETPEAPPWDFRAARIAAEQRAREVAWQRRRAEEVTFDEIYQQLAGAPWDLPRLRQMELDEERAVCAPNPHIHQLYREALARGKRVVFVSDMYLPEAVVESLLREQGYDSYDRLFLSSALGRTKHTGTLYRLVLGALGLSAGRVLHIGDNPHADVAQARAAGLKALHYPRHDERTPQVALATPGAALVRGMANCRVATESEGFAFWRTLGYAFAGPLYFGFATWLRERAARAGVERIFFLARDGWIMKRVYDRLGGGPPSAYLYASRRALNVPAISRVDEECLDFLTGGSSTFTVGQFLRRIDLDPAAFRSEIARAGFASAEERLPEGAARDRLRALFRAIEPEVLRIAAEERRHLLAYFAEAGLLGGARAAVVDLGWHGTLQQSIATVLAANGDPVARLSGYYLGLFEQARPRVERGLRMEGFLFHLGQPDRLDRLVRACVELFEFFHVAPHGGVIRFAANGAGGTEPVLASHELPEAQLAQARLVQEAALEFIDDMLALSPRWPWLRIDAEAVTPGLERLLCRPTAREARQIGELLHSEGFGQEFVHRPLARPPSLTTLLRDPLALNRSYQEAFWKEGFKTRFFGDRPRLRRGGEALWAVAGRLRRLVSPGPT